MRKVSKKPCSLEEEYAFEHKARIKAENYISELWEMHAELEKEVLKLQSIINKGNSLEKEEPLLTRENALKDRLDIIHSGRKKTLKSMEKIIKRVFK